MPHVQPPASATGKPRLRRAARAVYGLFAAAFVAAAGLNAVALLSPERIGGVTRGGAIYYDGAPAVAIAAAYLAAIAAGVLAYVVRRRTAKDAVERAALTHVKDAFWLWLLFGGLWRFGGSYALTYVAAPVAYGWCVYHLARAGVALWGAKR